MKKFKQLRKAYFTLLETLVAFALLAMLLTIIFAFFSELSILARSSDNQAKESFALRYSEARLSYIFQRLVNENENNKRIFCFYTQAPQAFSNMPSLIFTFDNEVRADPTFAGDLLARLYVDDEYRLRMASWSAYASQPHQSMHEEILLENVAAMNFEFYAAPARLSNSGAVAGGKQSDPNQLQPEKDKWHVEWLKDYKQMPAILHMKITVAKDRAALKKEALMEEEKQEVIFKFVLPSSKNHIHYPPP